MDDPTKRAYMKNVASIASLIGFGLSVVFSSTAQGAQPPAAIPCSAPEYRQFDFWVGNWRVTNPKGALAGTNLVTSEYGGCVVQEHWTGAGGNVGSSFNAYNSANKQWHQTWVDNSGTVLLLDGTYGDGVMSMAGQSVSPSGAQRLNRIRWTRIDGDHVRQLWDYSDDGGKTWAVSFDGLYTRVK